MNQQISQLPSLRIQCCRAYGIQFTTDTVCELLNLKLHSSLSTFHVQQSLLPFSYCDFSVFLSFLRLVRWPFRFFWPRMPIARQTCARHYSYFSLLPSSFCSFCLSLSFLIRLVRWLFRLWVRNLPLVRQICTPLHLSFTLALFALLFFYVPFFFFF